MRQTAVLLVNLGTPAAPTAAALRRYLAQFLADPRVVEIPRALWLPLLHGVILHTRPRRSAAKYARIWTADGSPLAVWTQRQALALQARFDAARLPVRVAAAMRYGEPSMAGALDAFAAAGIDRCLVIPLYPQYAAATTGSAFDALAQWATHQRALPALRVAPPFASDAGYIAALATTLREHWQHNGRAERLLLSFHGIPLRSVEQGDPYEQQCRATAAALAEALGPGESSSVMVTFQSRFGPARWLEPYTEPTLRTLARQGVRTVDVMCPGFVADCLETLEEVALECRQAFVEAGGHDLRYVPCLNAHPAWIDALSSMAKRELEGWLDAA